MGDTEPFGIVRPMGLTHVEFMRSLPAAVEGMDCRVDGRHIVISDSTRRIMIRLGPEQVRRLGSLALPQTQVNLSFEGFSEEQRKDFLRRFDLAFQRGGG
jgi:hypothetical protein